MRYKMKCCTDAIMNFSHARIITFKPILGTLPMTTSLHLLICFNANARYLFSFSSYLLLQFCLALFGAIVLAIVITKNDILKFSFSCI